LLILALILIIPNLLIISALLTIISI